MIKADAAQYTEAKAGAAMICLASLAAVLSGDAQKNIRRSYLADGGRFHQLSGGGELTAVAIGGFRNAEQFKRMER